MVRIGAAHVWTSSVNLVRPSLVRRPHRSTSPGPSSHSAPFLMPLTFPAHQAIVLPAKLRWPDRVDATALCVGAAMPDLTYPFLGNEGQTLLGGLVVAVPLTMLVCAVLRRSAATGITANLPDLGRFRIRSYGVITSRRPPTRTTVLSALVGVLSHVLVDSFTHGDRFLSLLFGLDTVLFTLPRIGEVDIARMLQSIGHVIGSIIGLWLFWVIGSRRLLDDWYGPDVVRTARGAEVTVGQRVVFWSLVPAMAGLSYLVFAPVETRWVFKLMLGATVGALIAGSFIGRSSSVDHGS